MTKKVFIAGHGGMVGSAIKRRLNTSADIELVVAEKNTLDLRNQSEVNDFFTTHQVDQVYLAAAKVGGIHANNTYPADFIRDNLLIQSNVIEAAAKNKVSRLLFLGSSCIYPKHAEQPMSEDALLSGPLESTNEPYAIAKIAGIKLCESYNRQYGTDFRSVMPTNLYGEGDNFHPENSHVIPAMMRRFHLAKQDNQSEVIVWGTGTPMREFLHVDDMASACVHLLGMDYEEYSKAVSPTLSHVNIGTGVDCSIAELAETMKSVIGFKGDIVFDTNMPDGTPRKLLDISKLTSMGWQAKIPLEEGLNQTYAWFKAQLDSDGVEKVRGVEL